MKKTININENNVTICIEKLDFEKFQCISFENTCSYDLERLENMVEKEVDDCIIKQVNEAEELILVYLYKLFDKKTCAKIELFIKLGNIPFKLYYNTIGIKTEICEYDMKDDYSEFFSIETTWDILRCLRCVMRDINKLCLRYSGDSIIYEEDD